ncbi:MULTISPECIES: hypothetical protein [Rahnella]|uniref:Lipoprotein n=1 Tax=Rahnella laticis TaxID=2787622 RepID=A0ABS0EAX3_9GAMM|nr:MULTISPECIES: hypothetical protein [Rahnella]MBF7982201.1 hypothetical protein [Rahnella laticis]MBF8002291.1 hypothetical protein [Rahnella sp. LAC-M12]
MKASTGIAVVTASLLLSACSTPKTEKITAANGSSIGLYSGFASADLNNNRAPDVVLREVTPAYTAAGVGLNVLTSVLSGGIAVNTFSKENLKGTKIDALPEPTSAYLTPRAKPLIARWLEKNGNGYQYKNNLNIVAAQWLLVYKDLSSANSDYELRYTVKFYKKPEDANMFSAWVIAECTPPVVAAPLADWRANNYALVTKTTGKYMDSCLLELDNQLPRLLKH